MGMTISKEEQRVINYFVDAARRGDVAYVKVGGHPCRNDGG